MKKEIIFPEKTSKIKEVGDMFNFELDEVIKMEKGNTIKKLMFGINVSMVNGDNFIIYSIIPEDLEQFKVGKYLKYQLVNTKDDKGKAQTKVKSYKFVDKPKPKTTKPLLRMFDRIKEETLLFLDIETIRGENKLKSNTPLYNSWEYKMRKVDNVNTIPQIKKAYEEKAPLYPEFGRIVSVSIGMIKKNEPSIISFYGEDEAALLTDFSNTLGGLYKKYPTLKLVGHSIIGFDLPYIMKRMLINGLNVPRYLDFTNLKPWDLDKEVIDIAKLWQSTSFYSASLLNIVTAFGIPSPKSDIDGSMVSNIYYENPKENMKKIVTYCERDVLAVINIIRKLNNKEIFVDFKSKTFPNEQVEQKK